MSSILDALKKSEAERQRGAPPTIGSELPAFRRPKPARRFPGWILPVFALTVAVAAWQFGLFGTKESAPTPSDGTQASAAAESGGTSQPTPAPAENDVATATNPAPAPATATSDRAVQRGGFGPPKPVTADPSATAASPAQATGTPPQPVAATTGAAAPAGATPAPSGRRGFRPPGAVAATAEVPATQSDASAATAQPQIASNDKAPSSAGETASAAPTTGPKPATTPAANPSDAVADVSTPPAPVIQPPAEKPEANTQPTASNANNAVPTLSELSFAARKTLPEIAVTMHVYSQDPQRRFALINGVRARDGESLEGGVEVVRILPHGVQVRVAETEFILPVSN